METDTIVAIATPPGSGALGIVRLSGPRTIHISEKIFFPKGSKYGIRDFESHTIHYGEIKTEKDLIDEAVLGIMKSPRSYTGEDMIELTCHGSSFILGKVTELCVKNGARIAEPGEFTKRAFLNGKMDLSQAEYVSSLIAAKSESSHRHALQMVKGYLRDKLKEIKEAIFKVKAHIDADIEWGETDYIDTLNEIELQDILTRVKDKIENLLDNSGSFENLMNGFRVVICGKPNAGKSSLFNQLLNFSRSIVHETPGTTRDVVENEKVISGFLVKFIDTAGIGLNSQSGIDKTAAEKSRHEIEIANIIIYIIDKQTGVQEEDYRIREIVDRSKWIPVVNKQDLSGHMDLNEVREFCRTKDFIEISCLKNWGISGVLDKITDFLKTHETEKIMITQRQKHAFKEAFNGIKNAIMSLNGTPYYPDVVSYELQETIKALGKIDGTVIQDDLLDRIFNNFCIGK